jgi:N6-adenosine-specific RNA methylase IME4
MHELIKYESACRALAQVRSVDEVKEIRDTAIAMQAYARQAKNKSLEADAWEIRVRAETRLGEMMKEQKDTVGLAQGKRTDLGLSATQVDKPTLAEAGIDKNLAHRARKLASMSETERENLIAEGRADVQLSAERAVLSKLNRQEKHQEIAAKASALRLASPGPFPLIYADPPWKWGHFGEQDKENEQGKGRTPDQHYPTLTYDEIMDYQVDGKLVRDIAFKDAALFLWCTSANIELALKVMQAWGFEYKAHAVWVKDKSGMGLVFRNKHEPLLYGTRGNMPGPQFQPPSTFEYPRGRHSAKPSEIRAAIEQMYPNFDVSTRLELFARETVPGWTPYGFESSDVAA